VRARRSAVRPRWTRSALALVLAALLVGVLGGCARFPDNGPRQWRDKGVGGGQLIEPPRVPQETTDSPTPGPPPPPEPGQAEGPSGCLDPDPQVVATCLSPVSAIAVLPDGQSALVAERDTGRVLRVERGKDPAVVATVPVDPAGGGLVGLVLSPTYDQDQLLYAYAATPGDHRLVRVFPGNPPVPVLTGIPATPGDGAGALAVGRDGALLIATGAGRDDPGPGSLAGKLLRVDTFGHPFPGNPDPRSPIYSSGLRAPAGMCTALDSGTVWVTDRLPERDALRQAVPGRLGDPAWTWPDRPGVSGCVAPPGAIAVAESGGAALYVLRTNAPAAFTGKPQTVLAHSYGRLGAAALGPEGLIWLGTVNKGSVGPVVSSDDRAIRIQPPTGGGGAGPD
jgi:glucose/arabinose dehydrogenase